MRGVPGGGTEQGKTGRGGAVRAKGKVSPEFNPFPCPLVSQKDFGLLYLPLSHPCREVGKPVFLLKILIQGQSLPALIRRGRGDPCLQVFDPDEAEKKDFYKTVRERGKGLEGGGHKPADHL